MKATYKQNNYSVASYTSLVETLNTIKTVYEDPETTVEREVTNAQNALTKRCWISKIIH